MNFKMERVKARKDLLHFVEEHIDKDVKAKLGADPVRWIDELSIISIMLTGDSLVGGMGLFPPPISDPAFIKLGEKVFLYRGDTFQVQGVWIFDKDIDYGNNPKAFHDRENWTHYRMGTHAVVSINKKYQDLDARLFTPDVFEPLSTQVKTEKNKRPISRFTISNNGFILETFAKRCDINFQKYYIKPSYRLTDVSNIQKTDTQIEMQRFLDLGNIGVRVPEVIAMYKAVEEEYLFVKRVEGEDPREYLRTHRATIIKQDAQMLAALCILGYRKAGFVDFDDKLFNGKHLYLIDVDELSDIHDVDRIDFRGILINPTNPEPLMKFREYQTGVFKQKLQDTIYYYRDTMLTAENDRAGYAKAFFNRLGWETPDEKELKRFTKFSKKFIPHESQVAMMMDQ